MAASLSHITGGLIGLVAALPRGAGPADPGQDFGSLWGFVIGLNVVHTLIVLYYVWRIWFRKTAT